MTFYLKLLALTAYAVTLSLLTSGCGKGPSGGASASAFAERDPMRSHLVDGYSTLRQYHYGIDDQLNLSVTRELRLELFPQVLGVTEKDSLEVDSSCAHLTEESCGREKLRALRPGLYLLRYSLLRNSFEESESAYQVLDGGQKIAEVTPSNMIATIQLKLKDLRLMASRNHLLVEILPINESQVQKIAEEEWTPIKGATYTSILDTESNLHSQVFETSLDGSPVPRMIFAPFDLNKLYKTLQRQLDTYKVWLGNDTFAKAKAQAPRFVHGLGDLNDYVELFSGLETLKQKNLKAHYAEMQNLLDWQTNVPEIAGLKRAELIGLLKSKSVDSSVYLKLCSLWGSKLLPELTQGQFRPAEGFQDETDFFANCFASHSHGLEYFDWFKRIGLRYEPFFIFQDVLSVDSAKLDKLLAGGRNLTFQLTDKFYVRSREEYNFEAGFRPLSIIPVIGPYLSLAGTLAIDRSLKEDSGNELRFQTNMQLNVEQNTMALDLTKYRHCLVVRMNPALLNEPHVGLTLAQMTNELEKNQMQRALLERGLMVCGPDETTPIKRNEQYNFISSSTKDVNYQQDPTDLRNRALNLSLRGERDFQAFMQAGKAQLINPTSTAPDYGGISTAMGQVQEAMQSVSPAAAGIYVDGVFY